MASARDSKSQRNWWSYVSKLSTIVSLLTFLLGGGFCYKQFFSPDLRYTILPVYEVSPSIFSGIILENRGRRPAEDVWVNLSLAPARIEQVRIKTQEQYEIKRGGQPGDSHIAVSIPRIVQQSSFAIYFVTSQRPQLDHESVLVSSKAGRARESSAPSMRGRELFYAGMLGGIVAAGLLGFLTRVWIWWWGGVNRPFKK